MLNYIIVTMIYCVYFTALKYYIVKIDVLQSEIFHMSFFNNSVLYDKLR